MKYVKKIIGAAAVVVLTGGATVQAQVGNVDGFNPNSIRPIHESDQLYKTRVWRRMDLREKQNKPFFSENRRITRVLIESVLNGTLYPYTNDSCVTRMSKEAFIENMTIPTDAPMLTEEEKAMGFGEETTTADDGWGGGWGDEPADAGQGAEGTAVADAAPAEDSYLFTPRDASVLEIMEDIIFDKERGRQYYDIQSVTMILPPENFPNTGLLKEVASFRYKDLIRSIPGKP